MSTLKIHQIPTRRDNDVCLLCEESQGRAAAVDPCDAGPVSVACALGWLDLRLGDKLGDWGERWPRLDARYREFCKRPSMQATAPQ